MRRKLTVIFSADVVGYSGLMERDEAGTLARLQENRKSLFDPCVAAHGGRIFKLMGDGVLIEFPSAAAAVTCALEVQQAMETSEAHRANDRLAYRIGINLGDVIVEGDDMYGEGVNVAARLQALAPVGGIALSRNVADQVAGKVAAAFEDLGLHTVKNIERPVHVFAARRKAADAGGPHGAEKPQKVSICVLPFANMSGDAEQEYFSDGISEDIITDLSRVSALWVAARNTAFTFKGKSVDVPQAARQLKVSHILEGSVRKAGGRVRITAQLVDATGGHVWAERWDRDLNDIFALQDEISKAIVNALKLKLLPEEEKAIGRRDTSNPEAYELFLMARQFERTGSERMKPLIVRICKMVVALDPNFARAWALMSMAEAEQRGVRGMSPEHARMAAERAVALDPDLAEAHAALGEVLLRSEFADPAAGAPSIETALKLDPNCYEAQLNAGYLYHGLKRPADSLRHFELASALDPNAYRPLGMLIPMYRAAGDAEKVQDAARRCRDLCETILRVEPDHGGALEFFVVALAALGERERACEWTKRALVFGPDNPRLHYNLACAMAEENDAETALEMLAAVVPQANAGWLRRMQADASLAPLHHDPRFKAMIAAAKARLAET